MHTAEYVEAFTSGQLDDARVKRIGFGGDVTRSPVLINRTLAEVAGTHSNATSASQGGLDCHVCLIFKFHIFGHCSLFLILGHVGITDQERIAVKTPAQCMQQLSVRIAKYSGLQIHTDATSGNGWGFALTRDMACTANV